MTEQELQEIVKQINQNDPNFTHLNLSGKEINEELLFEHEMSSDTSESISTALRNNNYITSIDLSNNQIEDYSARSLIMALEARMSKNGNDSVPVSLDLSNNIIGYVSDEETSFQGEDTNYDVLQIECITSLNLSNNGIRGNIVEDLLVMITNSHSLTDLDLSHNQIDGKTASKIFAMLGSENLTLQSLNLSHNQIEGEEFNVVPLTKKQKAAQIRGEEATPENIKTSVNSFIAPLTQRQIEQLQNNPLRHLDLSKNDIIFYDNVMSPDLLVLYSENLESFHIQDNPRMDEHSMGLLLNTFLHNNTITELTFRSAAQSQFADYDQAFEEQLTVNRDPLNGNRKRKPSGNAKSPQNKKLNDNDRDHGNNGGATI